MLKDTTRVCEVCSNQYVPRAHNQRSCGLDCASVAKGRYDKYLMSLPEQKERKRLERIRDRYKLQGRAKEHWEANKERIMARRKYRQTPEQKAKTKEYNTNHRYSSWKFYFKDLLKFKRRQQLSMEQILELLEKQNYICTLSGIKFTRERGSLYNPSIDRIEAGDTYNIENIQLVCKCLNNWRSNTPLSEFISICRKVAEYNVVHT